MAWIEKRRYITERGQHALAFTLFGKDIIAFTVPTPKHVTGASGADIHRGQLSTEYNAALAHPTGVPIYERMRRSDTQVRKQLRGMIYPIVAADWKIEMPQGVEDTRTEQAKEFIEAAVLGIGPHEEWYPDFKFKQHLKEALNFLSYGFTTFEKVWAGKEGKMVIDTLAYRYPGSIDRVEIGENGKMVGLWQTRMVGVDDDKQPNLKNSKMKGFRGNDIFLRADHLLHYTFEQEGIDYFGMPMLRTMYKAWKFKEMLERYDVIDSQRRAAGMPLGTLAENGSDDDRSRLIEIVKDMDGTRPEDRWAVLAAGQELKFVSNDAKVKEIKESVARFDKAIADGASGRFMDAGDGGGGIKAVVGKLSDQFFVTLNAVADELCETIQRGWIVPLIEQNFPGLKTKPRLAFSRLALDEGLALVDTLGVAKQAGLIPHWGLDDENNVRTHLRLRSMSEEEASKLEESDLAKQQKIADMTAPDPADPGAVPARPGGGPPRASRDPRASQRGRGDRADRGRADRQKARKAAHWQEVRNLAATLPIDNDTFFDEVLKMPVKMQRLKELEREYQGALQAIVNGDIRKDFLAKISTNQINSANVAKVKARFASKLQAALLKITDRAKTFGAETVAQELDEMRKRGIRGRRTIPDARRGKFFTVAETAAATGVAIDVGKILRKEEEVLMTLIEQLAAGGLSGEALSDAVAAAYAERIDTHIADLGRRGIARSYNAGRDVAATGDRTVAEQAVRNEELDANTCLNCSDLHGLVVDVGSLEYYEFIPPNFCEGFNRCRGEYTYFPAGL